jgi:hypothetical protein
MIGGNAASAKARALQGDDDVVHVTDTKEVPAVEHAAQEPASGRV